MGVLPQEPMFRPGRRFHLFIIVRLLGRGGMAEVYEVKYQGHRYALKVLQRRLQLDPSQLRRFENEGRFLLRVRHPNLVDVHAMGVNEGVFWIRMELLFGMDLREAIHRLGPMSVGLVGAWLRQAAYGAHQCHSFGVVHRDIKPENVMLLRPDGVKLLDLGVAKIDSEIATVEGGPDEGLRGTALYMSPEQVTNEKHITPAADVYALGLTGWEMLEGESPFLLGGQRFELLPTLYKQVHVEVPPLHRFGFDQRLSRVFERALSKDWRKRQPDGLAFAQELDEAVEHYLISHPDESSPGEPVLAWLLGEKSEVPSFGTGPMAGRGPSGRGPRPSAPIAVGPLGSTNELPAAERPIPRFHTQPMLQVPSSWGAPLLSEPAVEPDERVTNLAPVPLGIRQFDTVSLPPALRDPSALRALLGYRPPGKTRRAAAQPTSAITPAAPASTRAVTLPATGPLSEPRRRRRRGVNGPGIARRAPPLLAVGALLLVASTVLSLLYGWIDYRSSVPRLAGRPTRTAQSSSADTVEPRPPEAAPDGGSVHDTGLLSIEAADAGPPAEPGRSVVIRAFSHPASSNPKAPRQPLSQHPSDIF
jgi:serine/threonine protein kinase